jgi:Ser/Thr protein kinase RdoA (MazF antagonist)
MVNGILLSQELRANGFPIPELILTKSMEPLAYIGDETYQVTEWVNGKTFHPGELSKEGAYSMGCLLGKFHSYFQSNNQYKLIELPSPSTTASKCENLLLKFEYLTGKFPNHAKQILSENIKILKTISDDHIRNLNTKSRIGTVYNSFWVEQVLFDDKDEIKALVDWTDGAGRTGCLIEDIDTAIHISALDKDAIIAFCNGYQKFNPLAAEEWDSVTNLICYRHLADTWTFDSWFDKNNRRMEHWENVAINWITQIPIRFYQWEEIRQLVKG